MPIVDALLPKQPFVDVSKASYYTNITGFVNGPASFYNLTDPLSSNHTWNWNETAGPLVASLNQTKVQSQLGEFNWTGIDKIAGNVRELKINESTPFSFLVVSRAISENHHRFILG